MVECTQVLEGWLCEVDLWLDGKLVVAYISCNTLDFVSLLRGVKLAFFGDVVSRRHKLLHCARDITSQMFGKTTAGAAREPFQGYTFTVKLFFVR